MMDWIQSAIGSSEPVARPLGVARQQLSALDRADGESSRRQRSGNPRSIPYYATPQFESRHLVPEQQLTSLQPESAPKRRHSPSIPLRSPIRAALTAHK